MSNQVTAGTRCAGGKQILFYSSHRGGCLFSSAQLALRMLAAGKTHIFTASSITLSNYSDRVPSSECWKSGGSVFTCIHLSVRSHMWELQRFTDRCCWNVQHVGNWLSHKVIWFCCLDLFFSIFFLIFQVAATFLPRCVYCLLCVNMAFKLKKQRFYHLLMLVLYNLGQ